MEEAKRARLIVEIQAQSPLAVGDRKPTGRNAEALGFISGGLIRGALAETILSLYRKHTGENHLSQCVDDNGQPMDCDFCDLFLREHEAAIFHNAYPLVEHRAGPFLLPTTAQTCKSKRGFLKPDDREDSSHGVFDTLIDRLCCEELNVTIPYAPRCVYCEDDEGRVDSISGFYSIIQNGDGAKRLVEEKVPQRLLTRVAINRRRLTAEDELLYSLSVLSETVPVEKAARKTVNGESSNEREGDQEKPPSRFVATLDVAVHLAEDCEKLLSRIQHLGGGLSRGLGKVGIKARKHPPVSIDEIRKRIITFNACLTERWSLYGRLPREPLGEIKAPGEWAYFTIDLQSDAILFDETGWRPTMVLSAACLQREAKCSEMVEIVRSYASYTYRSGWNAAHGLPKDVDVATTAGSVFVYRTPRENLNEWTEKLAELERRGIGARRLEGFGQVKVCDEFHLTMPGQIIWEEKNL
ncbi:MAG: CRISPR-associated RAMP protein Csx10 [Blastocatellia bacterium]|nr:CRISPR-associated RAMP protein Csx10 [Blastocatellia bacterium]